MVARFSLIVAILLAPLGANADGLTPTASGASTTLSAGSMAMPVSATVLAPLEPYHPEENKPVEDFFVVTITSLPFTGLWTLVGAALVGSISQRQFPPNFSDQTILSSASIAVGASLIIGLSSSISWGKGTGKPLPSTPLSNP